MKWVRKGQEQAPKTDPPPRSSRAPQPPPVASGKQPPKVRVCVDCIARAEAGQTMSERLKKPRPAPHPGPRCATDWRVEKKRRSKARSHARTVRVYGITGPEKEELIEFQGGGCVCMEWTGYNGATRALSIDHDHKTGVVRGALCKHCNDLLGRVRDDPRYFGRMMAYLTNPPAVRLFGERIAPGEGE